MSNRLYSTRQDTQACGCYGILCLVGLAVLLLIAALSSCAFQSPASAAAAIQVQTTGNDAFAQRIAALRQGRAQ